MKIVMKLLQKKAVLNRILVCTSIVVVSMFVTTCSVEKFPEVQSSYSIKNIQTNNGFLNTEPKK